MGRVGLRSSSLRWARRGVVLASIAGLFVTPSWAAARDEGLGLSFGLAPGVRYVQPPPVRAGLVQIPPTLPAPYGSTPDSALGWGIDGFARYALPSAAAPLGDEADVAVRVRTAFANGVEQLLTPPGLYGQMPIDGGGVSNGAAAGPVTESSMSFARYDVDLVYRTRFAFGAPIRLVPLIGFAYSRLDQGHAFRSVGWNGYGIVDELDTNSYGAVLGLDTFYDLPVDLYVRLGLEGDLLAASSALAAEQRFGGLRRSASDESTDFVGRVRGRLEFGWTWNDMLSVGIAGGADWGQSPTVVHPLVDSIPFESYVGMGTSLVVSGDLTLSIAF